MIQKQSAVITHSCEVQDTPCSLPNDKDCLSSSNSQLVTHSQEVSKRYQTRGKRKIIPPERFSYINPIKYKHMKISDKDQAADSDSENSIVAEFVTSSVIPKVNALANLN